MNASGTQAQAQVQALNTPLNPGAGVEMRKEKDATEAQTAPKFGELLNKMQAQYGAKAEKPREIKKTLGKDDFLRIMITQMRNQDPTNPFKAEQMATEMAQFTSVEQLHNLNTNFQKLAGQNQPMERMLMTQMIGKTVTIDKDRFPHIEGQKEALSVVLPRNASQVQIEIVNDAGETVHKTELGPQRAGVASFVWDGNKVNSMPAKAGGYQIRVEAADERGAKMDINNQARARISGVAFEGAEPVLLIGEGARQEKITLKNVVRVEDSAGPTGAAPARPFIPIGAQPQGVGNPAAASVAPQIAPNPMSAESGGIEPVAATPQRNLFTFEKGKGSQSLDPTVLPPQIQEALAKAESERGFPSGLSDPEQQKPVQSMKGGESE